MIDRSLNYGRHLICDFLKQSHSFDTVLDIGAGTGVDLKLARDINEHCRLIALESYAPNIKTLQDNKIEVYQIDIEKESFPFDNEKIDIIIANQILEHTKEVFWIFHEITRLLPVGGKLILAVPNLAALHNRILLSLGRQPSPIKTRSAHVRGFTQHDLLNFLESCFPSGYELRDFKGSNFYPFPPIIAKPLAKILPNMAWGIFLLLEKTRPYEQEFLEYPAKEQLETNFYLG